MQHFKDIFRRKRLNSEKVIGKFSPIGEHIPKYAFKISNELSLNSILYTISYLYGRVYNVAAL